MNRLAVCGLLSGVAVLFSGCGNSDLWKASSGESVSEVATSSTTKSDYNTDFEIVDTFTCDGFQYEKYRYKDKVGTDGVESFNDFKFYSLADLYESDYCDQVCHVIYDEEADRYKMRFSNVIDGTIMPSRIILTTTDGGNETNYKRFFVTKDFWEVGDSKQFLENYYHSASRGSEKMYSFDEYLDRYFITEESARDIFESLGGEDSATDVDNLVNSVQTFSEGFKADTIGRVNLRMNGNGYGELGEFMNYAYYMNQKEYYEDARFTDRLVFVYDSLGINLYFDKRDEKLGRGTFDASFIYFQPISDTKRFEEIYTEQYGSFDDNKLAIENDKWTVDENTITDGESVIPFSYIHSYEELNELTNKYGEDGYGYSYNGFVYMKNGEDDYTMVTSRVLDVFDAGKHYDKPIASVKFEHLNYEDLNKIYKLFKNETIGRG